jgi:hypothetical protein
MTTADITLVVFTLCNSLRVVACVSASLSIDPRDLSENATD